MTGFKEITSKDNSLIKLVCELQRSSKVRDDYSLFVLEGLRICKDAFSNGIRFDKLIVSHTALEKYSEDIIKFSEISNENILIPDSLFKKISETMSPQGIISVAQKPEKTEIDFKKGRFIGLENLQDPSNLGAIARTAEALGVSGIIMSKNCCDPYSPKSLRASMGTLLRLPLIITENFAEDIKDFGLVSYACVVNSSALSINDVNFSNGCVVVIGNEANGLTEETVKSSDFEVTIPMKGKAESLNASVAASIAAWEMMK